MGTQHSGVVSYIGSKTVKNNAVVHSFALQGEENVFYRTGFDAPPCDKGAHIEFEYTESRWGIEVDVKTIKVIGEGAQQVPNKPAGSPSSSPAPRKAAGGGGGTSRDQYWADKEFRDIRKDKQICYQAATNTAISIIGLALEKDALSLGSKKADKLPILEEYVKNEANRLYSLYQQVPDYHEAIMASGGAAAQEPEPEQREAVEPEPADDFDDDIPF